jgi:hypothetical protein
MVQDQYDARQATREALECVGMLEEYSETQLYSNPAKNAVFGMHFNWHDHLAPGNVVDMIAAHETLGAGLARAAHETLENTVSHRFFDPVVYTDQEKQGWYVGIVQELAARDGLGAFGEMWARENVELEGELLAPRPADEQAGIDIRTTEASYQVKTGEEKKSRWDRKEADYLIWVQVDSDGRVIGTEIY